MWDWITTTTREYSAFYSRYFTTQWSHMTPFKYAALLISIGVVGWMMMRNSVKKC